MSICNICTGALQHLRNPVIDNQSSPEEDTFGHHRSWQSLLDSIQANCWICQDASSLLPTTPETQVHAPTNVARSSVDGSTLQFVTALSITFEDDGTYGSVRLFDALSGDRFTTTGFELMRSSAPDPELASIQHNLSMSANTTSPSSMLMANYWLNECCRNHESCNIGSSRGTWFPTRLLDLGEYASPSADVRLVVTAEESPGGPYATLSHCWGQGLFMQLTKSNLDIFRRRVIIDDMPKTFQDAIAVCKSLAIRYLWIDSLCILQDTNDRLDWYHEAGLMHKVYSFSYVNISASDAVDGSWGLFRDRHPSTLFPQKVDVRRKTASGTFLTETYFAEDGSLWRDNVTKSVVNKRGWVFQERILSPRILHFCRDQIFWECRESSACEKYPAGFDASFLRNANTKAYLQYDSLIARAASGDFDVDDETFCYKMWKHMIYRYTATSLSKPSDKLVAMSGIAKALGALLKDTYIAGLWRKNLEEQLLWSVAGQSPPACRPSAYRAPSWSWASVDGSVMWIIDDCYASDKKAKVQSVLIAHATDDVTGQVSDGYMDLEGDLKPLHLLPTSTPSANMAAHEFREIIDVSCDFDDDDVDGLSAVAEEQNGGSWLYFMAIVVTKQYVRAVLIRPVEGQKGTFRRVGVMWHDPAIIPSHAESIDAILRDLDEEVKASLPCLSYEGGRHFIRLI